MIRRCANAQNGTDHSNDILPRTLDGDECPGALPHCLPSFRSRQLGQRICQVCTRHSCESAFPSNSARTLTSSEQVLMYHGSPPEREVLRREHMNQSTASQGNKRKKIEGSNAVIPAFPVVSRSAYMDRPFFPDSGDFVITGYNDL